MKKRQSHWPVIWVSAAVIMLGALLFAGTRLINLTALPMFTDEAIYIRWSQIGSADPNWRFISLTDGKQPLFTWIMMVLIRLLPSADPLFVGRLTSVLSGVLGVLGMATLSYSLFRSKRQAVIAALLYMIVPYFVVYDRMALYDSLVAAIALLTLVLSIRLARNPRLDTALLLGMVLGAGMLNKTSEFLLLYMLPWSLILFDWSRNRRVMRLGQWVGLSVVAAVLSQILYSILRLSPLFHMIGQKDNVFVYSLGEWVEFTFRYTSGNLRGLFDWLTGYLSKPLLAGIALSFLVKRDHLREKLLLLGYWFFPFVALAAFGKVLYPRFILFMAAFLMPLAAYFLSWLGNFVTRADVRPSVRMVSFFLLMGVIFPSVRTSYFVVTDILRAPIPPADRGQYIDDWPAGWGVPETVFYLERRASSGPITVYTDGTFGLFPHALEIYLVNNPNITIKGIWPVPTEMPEEILSSARQMPTFLVMNRDQEERQWGMELIFSIQKGLRKDRSLRLYEVRLPGQQGI